MDCASIGTWVTAEVVSAAIMNTHVRDNFLETGPAKIAGVNEYLVGTAANTLTNRSSVQNDVTASETTASTSFTALTTAGPSVTVTTGTRALVGVSARIDNNTLGQSGWMGYAISGATTASSADSRALQYESSAANDRIQAAYVELRIGLTAGSNTFTAQYRVDGGTGTFANRRMWVLPF